MGGGCFPGQAADDEQARYRGRHKAKPMFREIPMQTTFEADFTKTHNPGLGRGRPASPPDYTAKKPWFDHRAPERIGPKPTSAYRREFRPLPFCASKPNFSDMSRKSVRLQSGLFYGSTESLSSYLRPPGEP